MNTATLEDKLLTKEEVLCELQTMTEKQLQFLLRLSQKLFFESQTN